MGICISRASSEIHNAESVGRENAVLFLEDQIVCNGSDRLASVYSKEGSKGLNQDSAILYQGFGNPDGTFCGVFDGHGKNGHVVSEMVRNHLPLLLKTDGKCPPTEDSQKWKEDVVSAFRVMDKEIKLQENLDCSCSGTTAVVVIRQDEDLIIANLGDSRAILGTTTENGISVVQLTTDLKPGLPSEAERITNCNGRVIALKHEPHIQRVWLPHEDLPGLAMSRAFGDFLLKNHGIIAIPEVSHHRISSKDQFVVLASDGVWDVLSNNQVASIVWEAESKEATAKAVVEAATAAWRKKFPNAKMDDCSVVCLFLQKKHANLVPEGT